MKPGLSSAETRARQPHIYILFTIKIRYKDQCSGQGPKFETLVSSHPLKWANPMSLAGLNWDLTTHTLTEWGE